MWVLTAYYIDDDGKHERFSGPFQEKIDAEKEAKFLKSLLWVIEIHPLHEPKKGLEL